MEVSILSLEAQGTTMTGPVLSSRNPVRALLPLVGNTPLLEIHVDLDGQRKRVFAKYESLNLTGSIKDRIAIQILAQAYESGELEDGYEIVEATSGNTGIAFAAVGRALGHPVRIYMPDWLSQERFQILDAIGVQIEKVSRDQGGFIGAIEMALERTKHELNCYCPRQFSNDANIDAHDWGTGREILSQLAAIGLRPWSFVAGVGTGGTVMGVARAFQRFDDRIGVHPLEPANSPTLTMGHKVGSHRIQGISDEFIPEIVKLDQLDAVLSVDDGDSILMAQKLSSSLGLAVGISSGANFLGALQLLADLPPESVVVTVFPDSNKKYLSTDLIRHEPVREDFWSPRCQPLRYRALPRPAAELQEALLG